MEPDEGREWSRPGIRDGCNWVKGDKFVKIGGWEREGNGGDGGEGVG